MAALLTQDQRNSIRERAFIQQKKHLLYFPLKESCTHYLCRLQKQKNKKKTIWILSGLTNKQFFFSLPILHYVLSKGTTWFPILWKTFNLTKEHTTSPCSPTFGERYVANQDASLPVLKTPKGWILPSVAAGSNQSVAIKQAICAAYNLSCSGTGPSGLARITATTHPQPLVSDTVKSYPRLVASG